MGACARRLRPRRQPRLETRRQLNLRELVDRLLSQVEALKSEVRELTEAQQQPAHAIAAIEAEQEFSQSSAAPALVLGPAALSSGVESRPEPWGVVPLPRRPASPRPTLR